jgi:hypothetical protein
MLYTDNIGLKKPAYSEPADIADLNDNSDIIDREFGNRYLKSETYSVEQANNAIAQAIEALPNGLVYRGAVNYYKDLPTDSNELGDTYSVKYQGETGTNADGNEYAWGEYDGTLQWIKLGVNAYTKDEIDEQHEAIESDILNLENSKLNLNFGYAYAPGGSSPGWYKIARCEFNVPSNGEIRDATLYLEKVQVKNNTTTEYECLIKINIVANTNIFHAVKARALINNDVSFNEIKIVAKVENGIATVEMWGYLETAYSAWRATLINNTNRANSVNFGTAQYWELLKNREAGTVPNWATVEIVDCYGTIIKDLSDRITALENK